MPMRPCVISTRVRPSARYSLMHHLISLILCRPTKEIQAQDRASYVNLRRHRGCGSVLLPTTRCVAGMLHRQLWPKNRHEIRIRECLRHHNHTRQRAVVRNPGCNVARCDGCFHRRRRLPPAICVDAIYHCRLVLVNSHHLISELLKCHVHVRVCPMASGHITQQKLAGPPLLGEQKFPRLAG